ncbi:Amino acid permease/ SLC12A domain containing protein [Elaphomyces granulatus]
MVMEQRQQPLPSIRNPKLKQTLYGFQVFVGLPMPLLLRSPFIVLSAVIGSGIFNNNTQALELAGPAGLILSVVIIGVVAICVNECIAELTQQFPVYNAIVEYVRVFVNEDLGWVIGIAYWYTFALVFAAQYLNAAILSTYWGLDQTWQTLAFYILAPVGILVLNFLGVFYYGIVEIVGGFLKVCLVLGASILSYVIAAKLNRGGSSGPITDSFENDNDLSSNHGKAVCFAIPLVAYSFQGVEAITVTAFEARDASALRWPSRWIAYVALNVAWSDPHLPLIYDDLVARNSTMNPPTSRVIIFTTFLAGYQSLAGFLNGCLIFSVLSASNTSLYVSSRTLYGITREMPDTNWLNKQIRRLSLVVPRTGVPAAALLFSAVSFFWLPFLRLKGGYALEDLIEIMSVSSSVACLIKCRNDLDMLKPEYNRDSNQYEPNTFFDWFQPIPAWIGLVGCVLIFGLASATWWNNRVTLTKVAIAYAAHIVLFVIFVLLKLINKRLLKPWGVKLDPDVQILVAQLDRLNFKKLPR